MKREHKTKLKKKLLQMREDIVEKVRHLRDEGLSPSDSKEAESAPGHSFHMADVSDLASENFEREISLDLAANERELLHQIDIALKRIKEKNFGSCDQCGKDIGLKRLNALPYAILCITCKEEEDKRPV
ncbi:TraR/DksA family transcriptional regulator [Candidatus Omnitrophota bacterium]